MPLIRSDESPSDSVTGAVCFVMQDGDQAVPCRVAREFLEDMAATAGIAAGPSLELFRTFRTDIEAVATLRYENLGPDGEGLVWVRPG